MAAENTVKNMSEADDNWFVQNSRFIAERDKNTQIHNAEKRGHAEGLQQGLEQGAQQKAVEAALMLINEYEEDPEIAAKKMNAPLELVFESLTKKNQK